MINNSGVWERRNYTNKDIDCLYSTYIREYDIKSAGMNVLYREGGITHKEYTFLSNVKKSDRHVRVGYMLRDNKQLNEVLANGTKRVIREFMTANGLEDSDVLSIKNDAIFVINKRCKILDFDNVKFSNKNTYTSYYNLNSIEFYYNRKDSQLDIKGISDRLYPLHENYMIKFLKELFSIVENGDNKRIFKKLTEFATDYINMDLETGYYREFSNISIFRTNMNLKGNNIGYENYNSVASELIINYNYMGYIIPLMGLLF